MRILLVSIMLAASLSGCAAPGAHEASLDASTESSSNPLVQTFFLVPGQDVVLEINISGHTPVEVLVAFQNITQEDGSGARSWAFQALSHDPNVRAGRGRVWDTREAIAVSHDGEDIAVGPPLRPLVAEAIWGNNYTNESWVESLVPGHYHAIVGVEHATADFTLKIDGSERARVHILVPKQRFDAMDIRTSFDPYDFDEFTGAYTMRLGAIDLYHSFPVSSHLNFVDLTAAGRFLWDLEGQGLHCGYLNHPAPYVIAPMYNLSPGDYHLNVTGSSDWPVVILSRYEVPGHEDLHLDPVGFACD